jgi:hypothetical protein
MKIRMQALNDFIAEAGIDIEYFYAITLYQNSNIVLQGYYNQHPAEIAIKYAKPETDANNYTVFNFKFNDLNFHIVLT